MTFKRQMKLRKMAHNCFTIILYVTITLGLFCSELGSTNPVTTLGNTEDGEVSAPLILTPLITNGDLERAKSLSEIQYFKTKGNVTSYSGYFTTDPRFNSNLFFWFFPCIEKPYEAPLILWLQGGPGQPSTIGLFEENGPLQVTDGQELHFRKLSWTRAFNMLYIDNPVGTGCSFADSLSGYARNQSDVVNGLYEALRQFFILFTEYDQNEFYIAGESYTGKYAPNLAMKIHSINHGPKAKIPSMKINLKGIAIGNGFVDPLTMVANDELLYVSGLLDDNEQIHYRSLQSQVLKLIREENYGHALNRLQELIFDVESLYTAMTGLQQFYHLLRTEDPPFMKYLDYLRLPAMRKIIHTGRVTCDMNHQVGRHLTNDILRSAKPAFESVLNHGYKVLLYSGNLDILVGTVTTMNFLKSLRTWEKADEFRHVSKSIWKNANGTINGYVKKLENFYFVVVRNAGHMAIADQPEMCYNMMTRFVFNEAFD